MIHFPTSMFLKSHTSHFSASWRIRRDKHQAFTLIELLVVIVIIGILATLATVALTSSRANARDARRISDLKQISTALEMYQADYNAYPSAITADNALTSPDGSKTFMNKVPSDPSTNTSYAYGGNANFTLRAILEKGTGDLPAGNIIITSKSGIKLPDNTDARLVDDALTFGGSLIGHWPLDGANASVDTIYDLSGNGNNGTKSGAVLAIGRFGEADGVYSFDGINDYITSPSFNDYPNSWSDAITFSIWINIPSSETWHTDGKGNIVSKGSYNGSIGLVRYTTNNVVGIFTRGGASEISQAYGTIKRDVWNHIVGTQVGGTTTIYINGVSKSSQYTNLTGVPDSGSWDIGTTKVFEGNYGSYFNGSISDVRIYSKALVPSEISALYQATKP